MKIWCQYLDRLLNHLVNIKKWGFLKKIKEIDIKGREREIDIKLSNDLLTILLLGFGWVTLVCILEGKSGCKGSFFFFFWAREEGQVVHGKFFKSW